MDYIMQHSLKYEQTDLMIEFPLCAYTSLISKPVYLSLELRFAREQITISDRIQIKEGGS